ncbi:ARP2/3 complex 16kDa subunit [Trypanosoma brucei equiperdum]|uniref:Actin-related protein 2/3 complex subunit 5 n=1 Tax=Trypanosoma brucei equiperdum TaxID=630700 RepID=A0A3L6KXG7_9TRYP|nr:ARP2/3 complex 16kDa subunit [Trypanosoma brucei equiperdum]
MKELKELLDQLQQTTYSQLTSAAVKEVSSQLHTKGTSSSEIKHVLQGINERQQDTLMKVLYFCLDRDAKNSKTYQLWHAELHNITGTGSILRVMAEKNKNYDAQNKSNEKK